MGFDPLVPQNWYSVTRMKLENELGSKLLSYANNSAIKLITEAFPNIGLEVHKFDNVPRYFYNERANRKLYFDNFAATKGFDPLIASNWYRVPSGILRQNSIVTLFGKISHALIDTYPHIGLQTNLFNSYTKRE